MPVVRGRPNTYQIASLAIGSATALVSTTPKTITSFTLGAGTWDVTGMGGFITASGPSTIMFNSFVAVSLTNNAIDAAIERNIQDNYGGGISPNGGTLMNQVSAVRLVLTAPTLVYLVLQSLFTTNTLTGYGTIHAHPVISA